jgi:hypothetical protein
MSNKSIDDLIEVLSINTITFATAIFTNIESSLKILLLLTSILYTIYKWVEDVRRKDK